MNADELRRIHATRPFEPFTLFLTDGRRFDVAHPEFLAFFPARRSIIVTHDDASFDVIDLIHATGAHLRNGEKKDGEDAHFQK